MKKFVNFTINFTLVSLLIIVIGLFILRISDSNILKKAPVHLYEILTGSMEPTLHQREGKKKGDVVLVYDTNVNDIEEGDIISYYSDIFNNGTMEVVTHRVISIEDGHYDIKGDAEGALEEVLSFNQLEDRLVGKVLFNHKLYILSFLYRVIGSVYGFIFLIVIPLSYLIVREIMVIIKILAQRNAPDTSTSVKYDGRVYTEEEIKKMIEEKEKNEERKVE